MCRSYIILSQLWRLFINTNQSPLHLAKSHALVPMHALYTDKEIRRTHTHTHTPHVWRTHMHIANKEKDTSGWVPYHGSENWPPHTDKKTELTQVTTCIRAPNAQMKARVLHITNTKHTQTNKMHARTRAHTSTYSLACTHTAINREAGLWWGRESACSAHTGRICNFLQLSLY